MADISMPCAVLCHSLVLITLPGLGLVQGEEGKLPVLLVDGYNVLNARWKLLGIAEACPMNLEDEREQLINDTRDYALSLSCRSIVVFDAMASRHSLGTPRRVLHSRSSLAAAQTVPHCVKGGRQLVRGKVRVATCRAEGAWHRDMLFAAAIRDWALRVHADRWDLTVVFSRPP